jgi:CBS domain containing-hemolysin-like protein
MLLGTLGILAIALSVSFFCSLLEACVLSLSKSEVAALGQDNPRLGTILSELKGHIHAPLAGILILNTSAHTIGTSLAAGRFAVLYGERGVFVSSLLITFVMVQWPEVLPKTLGSRHRRGLAVLFGAALHVLMVGGGASISDALGAVELGRASSGTVASWIAERMGRTPKPGDEVVAQGARVLVRRIRRGRVFEAAVIRAVKKAGEPQA